MSYEMSREELQALWSPEPEIWTPVYDGESGESGSDTGGDTDDNTGSGDTGDVTFTEAQQKKVDDIVQKRLARSKTTSEDTIKQLETLRNTAKLTSEERDGLAKQIDDLQTTHMTETERTAKQRKVEQAKNDKLVESVTGERDTWKSRFETTSIKRAITDAVSQEDTRAYNPSQVVSLLQSDVTLTEDTEDGVGTGKFTARVKFNGRDSEGKPLVMDLTVPEAIEEMSKMKEYENLFISGLKDGFGGNNVAGSGELTETSHGSQEAYKKNRDAIKKGK